MEIFNILLTGNSVAHSIFIFALVSGLGLMIGHINFFGVRLGVAGVLFAGILFGHLGLNVNPDVLAFCREFGLILFVYTVGMQVGPGFFSSLKRDGLKLNLLAVYIVLSGTILAILFCVLGNIPMSAAVGLFSGATTNTPSLGAAQQAMASLPNIPQESLKLPGQACALAYPFGVLGVILTMLVSRAIFRINFLKEVQQHAEQQAKESEPLSAVNIRVDNPNLNDLAVTNIPNLDENGIVISRVMHEGKVRVALGDTRIYTGDILYAVGPREKLSDLILTAGSKSDIDVRQIKSNIVSRRLLVTKPEVVGKTVSDLKIWERYGITLTRVSRAEIEFAVSPELELHYGDTLLAVGEDEDILEFSSEIGNSAKQLDHPIVIPLFIGIALGVIAGTIPIAVPGVSSPVKLGLAGGPMIVAIILSRIGRIGKLIWYMPISANFMLREMGIVLFLSCVGLESGTGFVGTVMSAKGLYWMACAACITVLPVASAALIGRLIFKLNYLTLCGVLSGSTTNPPALAYANSFASSNAPSVAFATVYPLTMLMRVILAQILVIYFIK